MTATPPATAAPQAAPDNTAMFVGIIAAVIVAIVVIGILNLLVLRRRK